MPDVNAVWRGRGYGRGPEPEPERGPGRSSRRGRARRSPLPAIVLAVLASLLVGGCAAGPNVGAGGTHVRHGVEAAMPPVTDPSSPPESTVTTAPVAPPPPAQPAPTVRPMGKLRETDVLVLTTKPITDPVINRVTKLRGVEAVEGADSGTIDVGGAPAFALGVVPDSFRNFTPLASARVDQVWANVAAGGLAFSHDMAHERRLALGDRIPVGPHRQPDAARSEWISAFASTALPDVDVLVDQAASADLQLVHRSALLVSAPRANVLDLQRQLRAAVPGAQVELLKAAPVVDTSATFLTPSQIGTIITAATSRVGLPYVWGGNGPDQFDCSGLVGWAFHAAGIDVPRTAAQLYEAGPHIDPRRAQAGDLLFWANDPDAPGFVDHVAIYLGNGQMVVAPHTGDVVKVTTPPGANFMGVVRLDPRVAAGVGGAHYHAPGPDQ